jgi:hypothetical protein
MRNGSAQTDTPTAQTDGNLEMYNYVYPKVIGLKCPFLSDKYANYLLPMIFKSG